MRNLFRRAVGLAAAGAMAFWCLPAGTVSAASVTKTTVCEKQTRTSTVYAGEIISGGNSVMKYLYSDDVTLSAETLEKLKHSFDKMEDKGFAGLISGAEAKDPAGTGLALCSEAALQGSMSSKWKNAAAVSPEYFPDLTVLDSGSADLGYVDFDFYDGLHDTREEQTEDTDEPLDAWGKLVYRYDSHTFEDKYATIEDGETVLHTDITITYDCEVTTVIYTYASDSEPFEVSELGDGTLEITAYNGCASEVVIPSEIGGKKVTSIGEDAFFYNGAVESVTVPDSVKIIKQGAFSCCVGLKKISLPEGLTVIDTSAFDSCKLLESVKIPSTVIMIGASSFEGCENLKTLVIPEGVQMIGESAFSFCESLTAAALPSTVTSIGELAFSGCSSLVSFTVPEGITRISNYMFNECTSLKKVIIPDSVTDIGSGAFFECESLTGIELPDSVANLGSKAFAGCYALTGMTVPATVLSFGEYAIGYRYDYYNYRFDTIPDYSIRCYEGSAAEQYAKENKLAYELIADIVPGDADGSGDANMQDYALLQRSLAGWNVEINEAACDLNRDGLVNMLDYGLMQRMLAGWDIGLTK